jgi:hypothetical protein
MNSLPYAVTTASFTQPASGSTVTVSVTSTVKIAIDQVVFVQDGGYYEVSGITDDTDVVLKNLGLSVNAAASANIPSGSLVGGFAIDLSGNTVIVGDGVAGTPAGGVVSVQGVSGGTAVPVSGTVAVSNLSSASPSLYNNFQATSLSGTFGVTNGSATVTTTANQTGVLSSGGYINFASQAQTYEISSVGASSLTLFSPATYTGTTNAATTATYPTLAQSGVIKNATGTVFGTRSFGGNGYIMLFNSASVPSPGTVPALVWAMSSTNVGTELLTDAGLTFSNGITFGFSTIPQNYVPVTSPSGTYLMVTYA